MRKEAGVVGRFARLPLIACLVVIMAGCGALTQVTEDMSRSGQLPGEGIWKAYHEEGIRSIICLRGDRPGRMEWDVERGVGLALDMPIYYLAMSSGRMPHRDEVLTLLNLFETAERPVLIHCAAGVDRTGLACVLWMMVVEGQDKEEAREQLSFCKGHMFFWQNTGELDKFVDLLPEEGDKVREWVEKEYER